MKKVLFVLAASAFFVACNSGSTTETDTTADSTVVAPADNSMMTDSSE